MGTCYSSIKGKRKETVEILTLDAAATSQSYSAAAEVIPSPAVTAACSSSSPKQKRPRRWMKKSTAGEDDNRAVGVPGRMSTNGASKVACIYTQQGKKGANQDAMIVWENFCSRNDTVFCGVFDGHGPFGHLVAKKVRDSLPLILRTQWEAKSSAELRCLDKIEDIEKSINSEDGGPPKMDDDWHESMEAEENEDLPEMFVPLKKSMLKSFKLMDKELRLHPTIDCFCSGTTAVTLVKQGQDLVIGNVGDSRAVLAARDKDNLLTAIQLTVDLKPDLPGEAARIQQCKGRVFALQDEPEVARVWLPNTDSPGLAMARAFGDFCLKDFGLISVPDVYYRRLREKDQFIIMATDGVWDVLSNKEAVDIVASAPSRATAARALVDCAVRAWRLKYPTSKNDDCAVVCLFLEHPSPAAETTAEREKMTSGTEVEVIAAVDEHRSAGVDSDYFASVGHFSSSEVGSSEIVPVSEIEEKLPSKSLNQSRRSLAECISAAEEEEWSALEGLTRVNTLLSLPRFLSSDRRSISWRKWL